MKPSILFLVLLCIFVAGAGCKKSAPPRDGETGTGSVSGSGSDTAGIEGTGVVTKEDTDTATGAARDTGLDTGPRTGSESPGDSDTVVEPGRGTASATVAEPETDTPGVPKETDTVETPTARDTGTPTEAKESCRMFDFESPVLDAGTSLDVGPELDLAPGITLGPYLDIHDTAPTIKEMSEWCLDGQWLGTGPFQIDMDEPLEPPVGVSVEVNMSIGPYAYLSLLNLAGEVVAEDRKRMTPHLWPTCISPGVAAADGLLTTVPLAAQADEAVSSIIVAYSSVPEGWRYGQADEMAFDNLAIRAANLPGTDSCPWNAEGMTPDTTPRCDMSPEGEMRARYLCHDKPATVDSCEACDVECLQQIVRDADIQINECMTFPEEIVCGPNPNTEQCCYVVHAGPDWCVD